MDKNINMQMSLYKESYYNFKLVLEDGRLMIYNTKTGAISLLSSDEKNSMQSICHGVGNNISNGNYNVSFNNDNIGYYKGTDEKIETVLLEQLLNRGFIVKEDKNELDEIKNYSDLYRKVKNVMKLIVLPAEACNFSCPYCFIYRQRNLYMRDWVYEALYQYIINKVQKSENKKNILQLSWYGGEPLLAADNIIAFMKKIYLLKNEYDIEIDSSLYTNGYLLTRSLFEQLLECGISTYQVTIDGNKDSHNQLRSLKNGEPTFDVIFENLLNIKNSIRKDKKFKFYIRANFLKSSLSSMEELFHKFTCDFGEDERFQIYFRPVYHFKTTRDDVSVVADEICNEDEGLNKQTDFAFQVLSKNTKDSIHKMVNVFKPLPQPMYNWCTGRSGNTYIIGADGAIFMCDTMMVEKDQSVGQLTKDGRICLNERAKPWTTSIFEDDNAKQRGCFSCRLLPICLGGCKLSMESGYRPCLWNEQTIFHSMKKYVDMMESKS